MQRLLYVYEERVPEKLRQLMLSAFPATEFVVDTMTYRTPAEEQMRKLASADVVFFAPGRHLPDEVIAAGRSVKLMQLWSSGYDKFNLAGAEKAGIPVANNNGANAWSVAEHTILLMLAVLKSLPDSHRRTTTGAWAGNSHGLDMFTLRGKTVGIVGFGRIGQSVAKILRGFEARTIYFDPRAAAPEVATELAAVPVPFDALIGESDIVTLHLHASDDTAGLVSAKVFAGMKRGSILINVSRASLVDQAALLRALEDGTLRGAGLDVYASEPTRPDDPLLAMPNVVATPHMAGSTYDAYIAAASMAVENFRRVARSEPPVGLVSRGG
jgi:phosphoglycerate dehydrogenase-like enzyme